MDLNIKEVNLSIQSIPFESNSFDYCTAFDFVEHMPRLIVIDGVARLAFVELMNEIYRVLKPGGIFFHQTPAFPAKEAFQDPTHVNIITEDTMPFYFCQPDLYAKKPGYGFEGRFELISQSWFYGIWLIGAMRAMK